MDNFKMCNSCSEDYHNVLNRRFHAQPIACNSCGPVYLYKDACKRITDIGQILCEISTRISNGKTIAVKGLGGYHLMCDAMNEDAVSELRRKKQRDSKPFAVMFRDLSEVMKYCNLDNTEEKEITSWRRPILILSEKKKLAPSVSNGLNTIGAMLPYMPFHYLLFESLDTSAVVLTSGNISDDPIIINDLSAENELLIVADSFLSYNREISNRADDSVIRIIDGKLNLIRRSRGFVPGPVDLNCNVNGIIALGAEQKSSFCIGKGKQAILSQYIGDIKNMSTFNFFKESIERFYDLFRFKPIYIVCDLHPDYLSTQYAMQLQKQFNVPLLRVQHHHAHIASCMAEYHIDEKVIGVSLDGTGFGTDGNIWGSEFLIADLREFTRYTYFDYIPMPGGEKAIEEPWRMAYSYLYRYFGDDINYTGIPFFKSINNYDLTLIKEMIIRKINSPLSSGAGRLFDAVSSLSGLCHKATFDSEAPMRLESVITGNMDGYYPFKIDKTVVFAETFKSVLEDLHQKTTSEISIKFHNTVAQVILEVSKKIREESSINKVVLSGGVFQNKYLLEKTLYLLNDNRFEVFTNHLVPANDGGISLGQLIIASKKTGLCA